MAHISQAPHKQPALEVCACPVMSSPVPQQDAGLRQPFLSDALLWGSPWMDILTSLCCAQSLTKAVAEVARRVATMRNPSSEVLREQALKIAEYKSPGMWVLMDRYQKFADELKAEADLAASPDQAAPAMSAGASPEPEVRTAVSTSHTKTPQADISHADLLQIYHGRPGSVSYSISATNNLSCML